MENKADYKCAMKNKADYNCAMKNKAEADAVKGLDTESTILNYQSQ